MAFRIILFCCICFNAWSGEFLVGIFHKSVLPLAQEHSSLIIFKDGKYVLNLSSDDFGLCLNDTGAGKFVGKFSPKDLKKIKDYTKKVDAECSKIKDCKTRVYDELPTNRFVILDYTNKAKKYAFYSSTPKLINFISNNLDRFKKSPKRHLKIETEGDNLIFSYKGTDTYKTTFNEQALMVRDKNGNMNSIKHFLKGKNIKERILKFDRPGQKKIKLPISLKSLKSEIEYLIYSNKVEAHHQDSERKIYTLCTKLK